MSQRDRLRALLNERMVAAGDSIFDLFEGKIEEYEEELRFLNEEYNLKQKLLFAATKQGVPILLVTQDEAGHTEEDSQSPNTVKDGAGKTEE